MTIALKTMSQVALYALRMKGFAIEDIAFAIFQVR